MKRAGVTIAVLALVQLALVGLWWAVERSREAPAPRVTAAVPTERRIERPTPALPLQGLDGAAARLDRLPGPGWIHIWATWCPPCRVELPGLIAFAARAGQPLHLVSVDPDPAAVRGFFAGRIPPSAFIAEAAATQAALDVSALPVTFYVDGSGTLRRRWDGARDWAVDPAMP